MNTQAVLALALAVAGSVLAPVAGADPVPGPDGQKCFVLSATDPNVEAPTDSQFGVLVAGPLNGTGTLTCSIQVGGATHAGANSAIVVANDDVVAGRIFDAELVSYVVPPNANVYVCAQYTEGSSTIYWTGSSWDDDVNSPCEQAVIVASEDPLTDTVIDAAVGLAGPLVVCPALQLAAPLFSDPTDPLYVHPSGDAFLQGHAIWDCGPLDQRTLVQQAKVVVGPLP